MENGLSQHEAKELLKKYGKNVIESEETFSATDLFLSQFKTVINAILGIAAFISFLIAHFVDGTFIAAIIILNACFGFIQEYRAQKSLEKLKDYTAPTTRAIRDGKEVHILAEDLVPGDVVVLSEGARIPADGSLIEVTHLEIDESVLTGESLAVIKADKEAVFLGTLVTKGHGLFQVEKTGKRTRFGQIADTLASIEEEKTPLQKNLDQLGKTLSYGAVLIGLCIIPLGMGHEERFFTLILVAVSIGIAAIPEGLPAVVTIAFAVGTHRMARKGAIVRKMAAIETLGAMQAVVVDKTGTITKNHMRVKKWWVHEHDMLPLLAEACVLGNTASLIQKGAANKFEVMGDQTDGALLLWAKEQPNPPTIPDTSHVIDEYVFDSKSKTITTVWKNKGRTYVFVRGAPEAILAKSNLSHREKENITKRYEELANEELRVIGFAMKVENHTEKMSREKLEKDLNFLGFMGLYDPPRDEVKEAVKRAKAARIHVMMVTGDNELTALSVAKEIGLIDKNEDVVTSEEMQKMTDEELGEIIMRTSIFARTQPEEKLRIVSILKQKGIVVGVTGDGVNDALALKKADVGIAMGEGGTDVAKEAADIVLTDDNFATLIKAVEEGRIIYKNIMNAVIYLISGNLAELSFVFFANLFHLPFAMLPTQILWINLITDSLPALALATGNRDATVLSKAPRNPKEPILNLSRIGLICLIGFSLAGFLVAFFALLLQNHTETFARGVTFNLLIYFHLLIVMGIGWQSLKRGHIFLIFT